MNPTLRQVAVAGAGPAGAFFALELARLCPEVQIDLYQPAELSPGAGIVMAHEFADRLRRRVGGVLELGPAAMASWDQTRTVIGQAEIWSAAFGMNGLRRADFRRQVRDLAAQETGVRLVPEALTVIPDGPDLVVLADGAGSRLRAVGDFGTTTAVGRTAYLWMSVPLALPPSFLLHPLEHGVLTVHAYPHGAAESTFIVEADPATLAAHDLLEAPIEQVEKLLAAIFLDELRGHLPIARNSGWQFFRTVANERWQTGRTVLIGDAAHTAHFSIGSGTTMAIDDAWCLAGALAATRSVPAALADYVAVRRPIALAAQAEAAESAEWFERISRRPGFIGRQAVFSLRSRRTVNTYARLRDRDPVFVAGVVAEIAADPALSGAEPADLPIRLGGHRLRHRLMDAWVEPDGDPGLRLPAEDGDLTCLVAAEPPIQPAVEAPSAVLLRTAPPAQLQAALAGWRSAGVSLIGVLMTAGDAPSAADCRGFDFVVVPADPGAGRSSRTTTADEVRYQTGLPVILLGGSGFSRDDVNTVIAAGRIDLLAVLSPPVRSSSASVPSTTTARVPHPAGRNPGGTA